MSTRPEKLTMVLAAALTFYASMTLMRTGWLVDLFARTNTLHFFSYEYAQAYFIDLIFIALAVPMLYGKNWARYAFSILVPLHFVYRLLLDLNFFVTRWQTEPYLHSHIYGHIFWLAIDVATIVLFVVPLYSKSASAYFK